MSAVAAERRHVLVEREFLGGRELAAAAFHQTEILGDAQHPRAHELGLAKLVEVLSKTLSSVSWETSSASSRWPHISQLY